MTQEEKLAEIILGYRKLIHEKYDFENLKKRSDIPKVYTRETADDFRNYFLNYSYPKPEKRQALNESFQSLDNYLKNPEKLLRIIIDSRGILFKFGRHLPKILNAGIKALKAFRTTNKLEEGLVEKATINALEPPYSAKEIHKLITKLSKNQIENHIKNMYNLFDILRDTKLVSKIKQVLDHLISKMKDSPNTYAKDEIKGLEIGNEIIVNADAIFRKFNKNEQLEVFNFIIKMEREIVEN